LSGSASHADSERATGILLKFYDMDNINQAIVDSESGTGIKPIVPRAHE
jgi:hypothetical protein